ncbi:MAG: hypothetical protein FJW94_05180 [Actinobacteria bacterium]|nr:hypothetical protein [Actinomycetota bacterium]
MSEPASSLKLRRQSIVAAPLLVAAVAAFATAAVAAAWAAWDPGHRTDGWWLWVATPAAVGVLMLWLARGCLIVIEPHPRSQVRDVTCWRTRRRVPADRVERALVQRGIWRLYVLVLDTGEHVPLLGASPTQWPARLLPSARQQDVDDLELLANGLVSGPAPNRRRDRQPDNRTGGDVAVTDTA